MLRHLSKIAGLAVGAMVLTACAPTGDSADSAESGVPQASAPAIVDPALLDAGEYLTKPRPPLGNAGDPVAGIAAEAQHMADFVVGPWDADETLVTPYLSTFYLLNTSTGVEQFSPESVAQTANGHGFINGFASARQATDQAVMIHAVLRFPSEAAAAAAASAMNTASAEQVVRGEVPAPVAVPGHPEAAASTYPFTPHESGRPWTVIRSFAPHGPYVFMDVVQSVEGIDPAVALVQSAIDAQGPSIDEFRPADVAAFDAVPLDPTGLLAKTVPAPEGAGATKNAVYNARGAMHFQSNPVESKTLFTDTDVTAVAIAKTNVYQARDPGSALMITEGFNKEVTAQGAAPTKGVPDLPASHCAAREKSFYCVAPAGRFAIEVNGMTLPDAQQQTAAQYILLTAS